ncbi:hypothetical protein QF034_002172 [Streptomyces africanus]|uniref:Uncharacterized protein n=1 Tax=Streptomyces africanus TaxID=231024 RepID=A0ABU0QKP8_9ACTN|nr:hypothetical protein [Streptomyces africanus]MDQ0747941.1 hypothetical protein [Streptomyces africanus]
MNNGRTRNRGIRAGAGRGPWAVLRAVTTVVLGPAAATASALDQANAAPLHEAVTADQPHAHLADQPLKRSHSRG